MNYFVTGATGFIGRFLIPHLLARGGTVYALMRPSSMHKMDDLRAKTGGTETNLIAIAGDVLEPNLVKDSSDIALLKKAKITHLFHLAAVYDMGMDDETGDKINNQGTMNVLNLLHQLDKKITLHHVSSVAVAGKKFAGVFTEKMFDEGQQHDHPYYRTKFQSEKIVRENCQVAYKIYRPGMVVGHSQTGEMDKVDGPYYFFKTIQNIRDNVPKWLPLLGIEGGYMPLCPIDYVVAAMDHLAHTKTTGNTFHLVQSPPPSVGSLLNSILNSAHGPEFTYQLKTGTKFAKTFGIAEKIADKLPLSEKVGAKLAEKLGMPLSVFGYAANQAIFDDSETRAALAGSGIACPQIEQYMPALWQYWEENLDVDVDFDERLTDAVKDKVVMITGASSGIGLVSAKKLGKAGARVILVARGLEKLEKTQAQVQALGGTAFIYSCDLNDLDAIDACADQILADHGAVDILINNAGRSIRRAVMESLDRFHDFERTMRLNYFGTIRLIMKLLPSMKARKTGQIINISSIGCLTNVPRFSAYVASKAAVDAFSRCLSAEVKAYNIELTTIYMPLVRTPMIAPTKMYQYIPVFSPDEAGELVSKAIIKRPKHIQTALGTLAETSYALWPKLNDRILSVGFALFPSSAAARGAQTTDDKPKLNTILFANIFKGSYW